MLLMLDVNLSFPREMTLSCGYNTKYLS